MKFEFSLPSFDKHSYQIHFSQFANTSKASQLMLYREVIAGFCAIHTKHTHSMGRTYEFFLR